MVREAPQCPLADRPPPAAAPLGWASSSGVDRMWISGRPEIREREARAAFERAGRHAGGRQLLAGAPLLRLNVPLRLSHNSTFTPLRRMMTYCWITESRLFQAQ